MTDANPLLLIRVDANARVGLGHAARCLALAEAWVERGGTVRVLGKIAIPAQTWFRDACADVRWLDAEGDGVCERSRVAEEAADAALLVVDAYASPTPTDAPCPVHRIEDADVAGPSALLRRGIVDAWPRGYNREETNWRLPPRIVVATGGADPGCLAEQTAQALLAPDGPATRHGAEVLVVAGPWSTVTQTDLPLGARVVGPLDARWWADLLTNEHPTVCVSAAGQTLWELAYLGVPTVAVVAAENQRVNVAAFEAVGAGVATTAQRAPLAVDALLSFPAWYDRCSEGGAARMGAGDGAARLAAELWMKAT